jgi:hypothetical protein
MKFFFPDAQDLVDPSFDFATEERSETRVRQRDDLYAHEVFSQAPYDGVLVSRSIVEGRGNDGSRYSVAQRHRLLRVGAREYFRLGDRPLETIGDCGAFSYVREPVPPVTVDEVIDFYDACGFDLGVSIDHIILAYKPDVDHSLPGMDLVPDEWRERQKVTLELAAEFRRRHKTRKCKFKPVGVAQGWSPPSYARSVRELQKMGYKRIGLGGMVALKTPEVLAVLNGLDAVRKPATEFHLFGVTRCDAVLRFRGHGVTSFDSTSPLKQAFMDDTDNYYTPTRMYTAVRVPQVEGNPRLQKRIAAGEVDQEAARKFERACLDLLSRYDRGDGSLDAVLDALADYERIHSDKKSRVPRYREVLKDRPWKKCPCEICHDLGIHVIVFRGAERNRRRGFHNLVVTYRRLHTELNGRSPE